MRGLFHPGCLCLLALVAAGCVDDGAPGASDGEPAVDAMPDDSGAMLDAMSDDSDAMLDAMSDDSGAMPDATSDDSGALPDVMPDDSGALPDAMPDDSGAMPDAMPDDSGAMPPPGTCPAEVTDICGHCPRVVPAIERTIHVAPNGDDGGDGSAERPYGTLAHAVAQATPGTEVRLLPGEYPGGTFLVDVRGTEAAPIVIGGAPDGEHPIIDAVGENEGLHLVRPRWVVLRHLTVRGASDNGINVDDGGAYDDPEAARFVAFRDLVVEDIGPAGNRDCLKLSGLNDFEVLDSAFARCGDGGSGVDMVGCHDGIIRGNRFAELGSSGIQAKGGTARIRIQNNRFEEAGARPINMGGSTGFEFFRPPLDPDGPNAEARHIEVVSNLIVGGQAAAAFVGCVECVFAHNTVITPGNWLLRILQETTSTAEFEFEPTRDGRVLGNIFVFRRADVRTAVNVGPNTGADSFAFTGDLYFAVDAPDRSAPELPVEPVDALIGLDPVLGGLNQPGAGSPAEGAGDPRALDLLDGSLLGGCYADPPTLGAIEVPERMAVRP